MTRELSHKTAVKLLRKTFADKGASLTNTEALDLFAKLKGYNAWSHMQQSLSKAADTAPTATPVATVPKKLSHIRLPEVLIAHYGKDGEVAALPREVWQKQDTEMPYWDWVEYRIDEGDGEFGTIPFTFNRDNRVQVTLPDGSISVWNIEQNLTDRWGTLNSYMAERKPSLAILALDAPLLETLCHEMYDETTFISRKDGQFGVYYEIEFASLESEAENQEGDLNPIEYEPHAKVVAHLLEGINKVASQYPNVEFCIPDATNIINDRPAIWAFVKSGTLTSAERANLGDTLFNL